MIIWSCKITWQIKTIISSLPQCLWLPYLAGWWITLSGFYRFSHARSRHKLKTYLYYHIISLLPRGREDHVLHPYPPLFSVTKRKKGNKEKKKGCFKVETIKRLLPRSKCYCFSHSRVSRIQLFFVGQPQWPTILFSVTWPSTFGFISQVLILYISTYATRFFTRKIFIRKWDSKHLKTWENVKKISSHKYLSSYF